MVAINREGVFVWINTVLSNLMRVMHFGGNRLDKSYKCVQTKRNLHPTTQLGL